MLEGKKIFLTGATSGLGTEAALDFASHGAHVIILARNIDKYNTLLDRFQSLPSQNNGQIEMIKGDLNSLQSVREACHTVKQKHPKIDMIINNAGIMNFKFIESQDGIEQTFQINLLSPLLICHLLIDCLYDSGDPKIIFTASGLHQGHIQIGDPEFRKNFNSYKSYRHSKLGVILICRLLAEKLKGKNISVYSQHPGIVRTELGRNASWFSRAIFWLMGKSARKGAANLIFLTKSKNSTLVSGEYYDNKKVSKITPQSYDLTMAEQLLKLTREYMLPHLSESSIIYETNQ